ncbi:hypothetical protein ARMSODRAFT_1026471 [Armillaria solidipes]|uniref:Uncharacterized protein n=1 Tax=Armillaria solidipes TaxID=1076256 RepID=A0A2H3B761_9AGAR|nr:hypothetical protein ARMSODRAFT_1026471 [Armillaria solidipes]
MSSSNKYHLSMTPRPYELAPTPKDLTAKEYKTLTIEQAAAEERYDEAVSKYKKWKAAKAKEAWAEKLRLKEETWAAKLEALRQQELAKKEWLWLEAMEQQQQLDLAKKEQEEAMEQKKQDNLKKKKEEKKLKKEQKKVEKATKAIESRKGKAAVKAMEAALVSKERGRYSKQKATVHMGPKRKQTTKSASVVKDSDKKGRPGPSKKVKVEISGPMEGEEEFSGNKKCMHCHQDGAQYFACPASKKSNCGWTCSQCKTKKAACSFNKGNLSALAIGPKEVSELLQKLTDMVGTLANKVDVLTGQFIDLWSCMDDLQALCVELKNLEGMNSEALQKVMQWWLDKDIAQLKAKRPVEHKKINTDSLYKVANHKFWYGLRGPDKMVERKLKWNLFQAMRNKFYKLEGCWSEWQFWKAYLQKHNCEDFMVKDSDLEEKILDGKVQKSW